MKKYKRLPHHSPEQLKRLQEIGNLKDCPLTQHQPGDNQWVLTDVITWLRLQHYRLEYRLLYYDLAVCCAYILFMCSALKLTAIVPQNWFTIAIVAVVFLCCILFIAVHMLPNTKGGRNSEPEAWGHYCTTLKYGISAYRTYLIVLVLLGVLYWHNERNLGGRLIVWIMPLATVHFSAGLRMLKNNLKAKSLTEGYLRQASRTN